MPPGVRVGDTDEDNTPEAVLNVRVPPRRSPAAICADLGFGDEDDGFVPNPFLAAALPPQSRSPDDHAAASFGNHAGYETQ